MVLYKSPVSFYIELASFPQFGESLSLPHCEILIVTISILIFMSYECLPSQQKNNSPFIQILLYIF